MNDEDAFVQVISAEYMLEAARKRFVAGAALDSSSTMESARAEAHSVLDALFDAEMKKAREEVVAIKRMRGKWKRS